MTETATEVLPNVPASGVRDALGEVRDLDDGKREALVSIPWEVLDTYNSDFSRDCFDEYLGQRSPAVCWQHDKREPIGRAIDWQKGQRANEFRLRFSDFDAVPRARQAYTQMRDGDITDVSFYYDQAKAVPHPSVRSAIRFTKARMPEISPVTVGSIPGASVTGVRQAADMAGVAELVRTGVITEAEGRTMLGLSGAVPTLGERQPQRESITLSTASGARSFTITIGDDGSVTTDGGGGTTTTSGGDDDDGDGNPNDLISAVDGAIDAALVYLSAVDLSALPSEVGMVYQLLQAADVACDELMDAAGIPDYDEDAPDGDGSGERATLNTADLNNKPDEDFAYIEPGGMKDKSGKTVPRDKRHFYIGDAAHVRNALSRIGQGARFGDEAMPAVKKAAQKFGVEVSDDDKGSRADNDLSVQAQVALARMSLGRR